MGSVLRPPSKKEQRKAFEQQLCYGCEGLCKGLRAGLHLQEQCAAHTRNAHFTALIRASRG
eukprot:1159813-Pelagomonas_calceolata.AAC.12